MISLIVIHHATPDPLAQTLAAFSLSKPGDPASELIVVDNASLGPLVASLQELFPKARFILNRENVGFGRAANTAARRARGDTLLFLNGDCFLRPGQLSEIDRIARSLDGAGAVGFRQITPEGRPQLTFGRFPTLRSELDRRRWQRALDVEHAEWAVQRIDALGENPFEVDWVSGSCLWTAKDVFEKTGGFDERFFMYFEDIDLCRRIQQVGLKIYHAPQPRVLHAHGASAEQNPRVARVAYRESQLEFARKHKGALAALAARGYLLGRSALSWLAALAQGNAADRQIAGAVFSRMLRP